MTPIQRYELIRPILAGKKTVSRVHQETEIPISTLYRYLSRFRDSAGQVESLGDKSHASHTHPNWLTEEDEDLVVAYKLEHPEKSAPQIATELGETGVLEISARSIANILKARGVFYPPFSTNQQNSLT